MPKLKLANINVHVLHGCALFPYIRFVSVMVTTTAMIVVGANLAIMDQTVANHKLSPNSRLLLTLMKTGKHSLRFFKFCVHMILTTPLF